MDSDLLAPRLLDLLNACAQANKPKFLGFLSNEEIAFCEKFLSKRNANYLFFGGEHQASRMMLCCYPDYMDAPSFPIAALTLTYRQNDSLNHRDFLGSLMALGIKRETVGDILIEAGRAVIFLKREICDYVIENLSQVGRVGVEISMGYALPLPEVEPLKESSCTIASCRLDCIVAALCSCSRNTAIDYIQNSLVAVNSVISTKPTKIITDNDVLSVRHHGKFQIVSTNKKTKKERIILVYKSY